jgi:membrane protease YdiL (CAAX protease family)
MESAEPTTMKMLKTLLLAAAFTLACASLGMLLVGFASILGDPAPGADGMRHKSGAGNGLLFAGLLACWAATGCLMAALNRRRRLILGLILLMLAVAGAVSVDHIGGDENIYLGIVWSFDLLAFIAWAVISAGEFIWRGVSGIRRRSAGAAQARPG